MSGHPELDHLKLLSARAVLAAVDLSTIRAKSLANLDRWNSNGVWCSAHDEWRLLLSQGSDEAIIAVMTGLNENANRLRQSPPYVGLVTREKRRSLLVEAGLSLPSLEAEARASAILNEKNC